MFLESGPKRPNPYNPSPPHKRVPLDLVDPSGLLPLPKPELPSDDRFTASAGEIMAGLAMQTEVQVASTDQNHTSQLYDERAQNGYL